MIWPFSKQQQPSSKSKRSTKSSARTRNTSESSQKTKSTASTQYHAVRIIPGDKACMAVTEKSTIVYLAAQAPITPLQDCTCKNDCSCKYKHLEDRRSEFRRESDIGLPLKSIPNDRRSLSDRRKIEIHY